MRIHGLSLNFSKLFPAAFIHLLLCAQFSHACHCNTISKTHLCTISAKFGWFFFSILSCLSFIWPFCIAHFQLMPEFASSVINIPKKRCLHCFQLQLMLTALLVSGVYVCVYVYMCVRVYIVCVYVVCVCVCMCMHLCMCVCVCVYVYLKICIST